MNIRKARPSDVAVIADFNIRMARETEDRSLDAGTVRAGVAAVLEDASHGHYWVAEKDDRVVGQLMVTFEWSDWRNGVFWWIQSVYIHSDYRRQGIFSALHRHVESLAQGDPEVCGLRLYVERDNRRAQRTYEALGMIASGYEVMETVFERPF